MLTARPSQFHRTILTRYFRRRARKMLSGILQKGIENAAAWSRAEEQEHPLIIVANHSSWWDAVMPILISLDRLDHDAYGIMEEEQLERFGFFRRLGMFSIDRENPRASLLSLEYAADLLRGTNRVLWLFPQGEILPNDHRPIRCYPGTAHLLGMIGKCCLMPVAFRYELLNNDRPTGFVLAGEPEFISGDRSPNKEDLNKQITTLLTATVDQLREDVVQQKLKGYDLLLQGSRSISKKWNGINSKFKMKNSK